MTPVTVQEYRVLLLLAEGHKQAAVARRLGVSARTVRRHTASLREKLGSVSDTNTIAVAYRHRWLSR